MPIDVQALFQETQAAFEQSDIKDYAERNGNHWYYSISSTRLTKVATLIVGFNWGADTTIPHTPQFSIPDESFKDQYDKRDLGSLQRIYEPLKKYFPAHEIENCVQTNFCFFRSKMESEISAKDLELSTPLFHKLLGMLHPTRIISFSSKLRDHFEFHKLCTSFESVPIPSNKRTLIVAKGIYVSSGQEIPIYFLPHPNAKFTSKAREEGWEYCFGGGVE